MRVLAARHPDHSPLTWFAPCAHQLQSVLQIIDGIALRAVGVRRAIRRRVHLDAVGAHADQPFVAPAVTPAEI
jgi:hypothetical protein